MPTFRLDQEPWIPTVTVDGRYLAVSLVDAFLKADKISAIAGSPLEAAALTRFLLAIVHLTKTPTSLDAWKEMWQGRTDFMGRCAEYVTSQADALDLFDEKYPFGQLPGQEKTLNPAHLLVYEAARKNNPVFADHRVEGFDVPISADALARGTITTNAYAGSSGGGYRSGPLAMRTVAMLTGHTLDQTLLLNTLVQKTAPKAYDWNKYGRLVKDGAALDLPLRYLWTSRCVRLVSEDGAASVSRVMLAPGNEMPEAERTEDPMVVMRKDAKGSAYVPLRIDAGRALWRSADVLLNWCEDMRRLPAVEQLHRLCLRNYVASDQPVSMRVCAVAGEAQGPNTELWRDEMLPIGLSVIADENRFAQLVTAVNAADAPGRETSKRIFGFAGRYLQNGADSSPDKNAVRKLADELSPDLTDFWAVLAPVGERIACDGFDEDAWAHLLRDASERAFRRAIERLPADARRFRAEFQRVGTQKTTKGGSK